MSDPLQRLLGQHVVLDTGTPIVYVGRLVDCSDTTFVLEEADMHYLAETQRDGVTVNRRQVVVMRSAIISVSRLADIVVDLE
jgi:hypothetical protein